MPTASHSTVQPSTPPAEAVREPHLFRFGLRQFFAFTSAAAMLVAGLAALDGAWAGAVSFVAALVAAHVLATAIGTRLRDSSGEVQRWTARRIGSASERPPVQRPLTAAELAALSGKSLAQHDHAPRRTFVAAAAGLIAGGFIGAASVPLLAGPRATAAEVGLGAVSCGVLGAWFALLGAHFWVIARGAWREAHTEPGATPREKLRRTGWFG